MTDPSKSPNSEAREMLERVIPLLLSKDLNGFAGLFAEDGVFELPFAPPGVPRRIQRREEIRAYLTAGETPLVFEEFRPVEIHETTGPETIIAEYDAHGEVATTGRPFTVRYLWVLGTFGGEIVFWRDYWSPFELFDLLGILPDVVSQLTNDDPA